MQRLLKSLTGPSLTQTSIQKSLIDIQNNLDKARGYLQAVRQSPEFATFETTAKFAQQVAEEIAKVATSVQQYGTRQTKTLNIAMPEASARQLQEIMAATSALSARIAEGIQAARGFNYPAGIVHYTDQIAGTLEGVSTLQGQLTHVMTSLQSVIDMSQEGQRALQVQQEAVKQAERDRKAYLAQYGGVDPVEIIAQVQAGTYPVVAAGIIPHKGETVLCATPASLHEDRTTSKHVGGSSGVSVPLGHGFRFRVGSYRGQTIRTEKLTHLENGNLVVTTQRIVFTGNKSTIAIPVAKVLHTILYNNAIDIRAENRKRREVFVCPSPLLTNTYVLIACHLLSV